MVVVSLWGLVLGVVVAVRGVSVRKAGSLSVVVVLGDDRADLRERLALSMSTFRRRLVLEDVDAFVVLSSGCCEEPCPYDDLFAFLPAAKVTRACAAKVLCGEETCQESAALLDLAALAVSSRLTSTHVLLLDADVYAVSTVSASSLQSPTGKPRALSVYGCDDPEPSPEAIAFLSFKKKKINDTTSSAATTTTLTASSSSYSSSSSSSGKNSECGLPSAPQVWSSATTRHLVTQLEHRYATSPWYAAAAARANLTGMVLYDAYVSRRRRDDRHQKSGHPRPSTPRRFISRREKNRDPVLRLRGREALAARMRPPRRDPHFLLRTL